MKGIRKCVRLVLDDKIVENPLWDDYNVQAWKIRIRYNLPNKKDRLDIYNPESWLCKKIYFGIILHLLVLVQDIQWALLNQVHGVMNRRFAKQTILSGIYVVQLARKHSYLFHLKLIILLSITQEDIDSYRRKLAAILYMSPSNKLRNNICSTSNGNGTDGQTTTADVWLNKSSLRFW
jgi:hypothetical protein